MVVAFGDADLRDHTDPIAEVFAAYPRSHIVGCSTSGQFRDAALSDALSSVRVGDAMV